MNAPRPPAHVIGYVEILGTDLAIEFLLAFGGAELALARNPRQGRLVDVVGVEMAARLAARADDYHLPRRIPTAKVWIARVWASRDLSVAEIARRLHTTDVTIRKYLAEGAEIAAPDQRQMRLF